MKQRVLVALLTVLVFASGFATRIWTEGRPALPPPPAAIGSEFAPPVAAHPPVPGAKKSIDRAQLIAEIKKLGPEIALFRAKMTELDAEFDRKFEALLDDKQRQHRAEDLVVIEKEHAKRALQDSVSSTTPLSDDEILNLRAQPLYGVLTWVAVSAKLDRLTKDYKLDAEQQAKTHVLIEERRTKFLAVVDSVTPPSIRYSRLAPDIQRLATPKK